MSEYFRALNRLEKRRVVSFRRDVGSPEEPAAGEPPVTAPSALDQAAATAVRAPSERRACDALLDNLRALVSTSPVPAVVLAGASTVESVEPIVDGLLGQARQRRLRLLACELVVGTEHRFLRRLSFADERLAASSSGSVPVARLGDPDCLELVGSPEVEELNDWLGRHGAGHDLTIIQAPPLLDSVDAALVARACNGLVLVVEPLHTAREMLRTAVERAQTADCRILGLVISGAREWLPRWLRRLFAGQAQPGRTAP